MEEELFRILKVEDFPSLNVAAGHIHYVTANSIIYGNVVLGDNSKIVVNPTLKECTIVILKGSFGANTAIDASGYQGDNGGDGASFGGQVADYGKDGEDGKPGTDGKRGGDGVNLKLFVNIQEFGSLSVLSNGGNGGLAGAGGHGGTGGDCKPSKGIFSGGLGGDAGNGGKGGRGGNGGTLTVFYRIIGNINGTSLQDNIAFYVHGGKGGAGGPKGIPGDGGKDIGGGRDRGGEAVELGPGGNGDPGFVQLNER